MSWESAVSLESGKPLDPVEMEDVECEINEHYCYLFLCEHSPGEGEGTSQLREETFTNRVVPPHAGPESPLVIMKMSPVFSI